MNASINANEAEKNKYKGQVHYMKVKIYQMKDVLAREMQISQSKSMELYALHEEEDDESNNNQTFTKRPTLEQSVAVNEVVPTSESPTVKMEVVPTSESPTSWTSRDERGIQRNTKGVPTAESPTA